MAVLITMKRIIRLAGIAVVPAVAIVIAAILVLFPLHPVHEENGPHAAAVPVPLPAPKTVGTVSVEEALSGRRSVREYAATPPESADISQMLWAAQGLTDSRGYRTAPSAGALYPLEISVACINLPGLPAGVYRYLPESHALERVSGRDVREELYQSALQQTPVRDAPVVIIIAADYNRTTQKYGERGIRYVHMEAGHAAENIYLQAYALGIGTVTIGAFDDNAVRSVLGLPPELTPLYLMPVGKGKVRTA